MRLPQENWTDSQLPRSNKLFPYRTNENHSTVSNLSPYLFVLTFSCPDLSNNLSVWLQFISLYNHRRSEQSSLSFEFQNSVYEWEILTIKAFLYQLSIPTTRVFPLHFALNPSVSACAWFSLNSLTSLFPFSNVSIGPMGQKSPFHINQSM